MKPLLILLALMLCGCEKKEDRYGYIVAAKKIYFTPEYSKDQQSYLDGWKAAIKAVSFVQHNGHVVNCEDEPKEKRLGSFICTEFEGDFCTKLRLDNGEDEPKAELKIDLDAEPNEITLTKPKGLVVKIDEPKPTLPEKIKCSSNPKDYEMIYWQDCDRINQLIDYLKAKETE